ncbi:MAG: hypothetical protein JO010_06190 [Alphaproteobacteria bacterium]|nr:hypothetical protein [Alphaproteobacteria bacterium]
MLKPLIIAGAVLALAPTCPAGAADDTGTYTVLGPGAESCGSYSEARRVKLDLRFRAWITGYITAANGYEKDTNNYVGAAGLEGVFAWLDQWCDANPGQQFAIAAAELLLYLHPNRIRKP